MLDIMIRQDQRDRDKTKTRRQDQTRQIKRHAIASKLKGERFDKDENTDRDRDEDKTETRQKPGSTQQGRQINRYTMTTKARCLIKTKAAMKTR